MQIEQRDPGSTAGDLLSSERLRPALKPLAGALGVLACIALFGVLADTRRLGLLGAVYDFPFGDKVGHFALFGLLALMLQISLLRLLPSRNAPWLLLRSGAVLGLLMATEELSQLWIASRNADVYDFLAGLAGLAVASLIALRFHRRLPGDRALRNAKTAKHS